MFNNGRQERGSDMADYLDRIGSGLVLARPEIFGFDYIPDELVGREDEKRELASMFIGLAHREGTARAVVTGPVGSGKTALAKTFCRDIIRHLVGRRDIISVHINCRNANTTTRVIQRIVQQLDEGHPNRGLAADELLASIRRLIQASNSHLILILDEVDHLLRRSGDDLLYKLLRVDEDQDGIGTLSLIMISQEQVLDLLESAVISRLGHSSHLRLAAYSESGLFQIAKQRCELGLVNGSCSQEILDLVSQSAASTGDARRVIELLEGAAKRAESSGRGQILAKDVQKTVLTLPTNVDSDNIIELPSHCMLILMGISRRLRRRESLTSGEAESLYHVVCEEYDQKPKGHTTVWKHLKHMTNLDIIATKYDHVIDGRGRTLHISMPHMLPSDVQRRVETLIKKRLRR
jgi:cell division control protein 6